MSNILDASPALVGKAVDGGSLRLMEVLGSGGFGVVYRALDISRDGSNRQFAVKIIAKRSRRSQKQMQLRELEFHSRVSDHPNIITFHRSFSESNSLFIVFDACLGGDLFTAITEKALYFYNDGLTRRAFVQIVDAVQYCHSKGIFHRDLKPENILCSADGTQLFLTDFGLATDSNISSTFGIGSSFYMSPECIRKDLKLDHYSPRFSDVWALGMILLNMTTGRSPWRAAVCSDDCFAAYLHDADFLRSMLPLSKQANALARRVLSLNPLSRISLEELRGEILNVETFYMTSDELKNANRHVREIVDTYLHVDAAPSPTRTCVEDTSAEDTHDDVEQEVTESPVDPEEQYTFASPNPDDFTHADYRPESSPVAPVRDRPVSTDGSAGESVVSTLNVPSDASSSGPITPNTHAVGDADIADALRSVDDFALPPQASFTHLEPIFGGSSFSGANQVVKKERRSNTRAFMRHAMQKLRIA